MELRINLWWNLMKKSSNNFCKSRRNSLVHLSKSQKKLLEKFEEDLLGKTRIDFFKKLLMKLLKYKRRNFKNILKRDICLFRLSKMTVSVYTFLMRPLMLIY